MVERLLDDPTQRDARGERGHRAYLEKWTPESHPRGYLALIEQIAARGLTLG